MLPTSDKSSIGMLCVGDIEGKLRQHTDIVSWHGVNQYLYLLSDEEIKENYTGFAIVTVKDDPRIHYLVDVIISEKNQCYCKGDRKFSYQYYSVNPIIATTDSSLNLPQFHASFLEEYVKRYNSKKSLEVEVEYSIHGWDHSKNINDGNDHNIYVPLVSDDDIISIRFKWEKIYSRSEVKELCEKAFYAGEAYRTGSCEGFKQIHPNKYEWIKENLK